MTPDQKLLVVHFVKQLQQCIEKREGAVSGRSREHKESPGAAPTPSLTGRCGQGKK